MQKSALQAPKTVQTEDRTKVSLSSLKGVLPCKRIYMRNAAPLVQYVSSKSQKRFPRKLIKCAPKDVYHSTRALYTTNSKPMSKQLQLKIACPQPKNLSRQVVAKSHRSLTAKSADSKDASSMSMTMMRSFVNQPQQPPVEQFPSNVMIDPSCEIF